jgi:chromosome segregation ATPase
MALLNFFKNYGKVSAERAEDGFINLAVTLDRDGVAETAIKQKQDEHEERIRILAEAKTSFKKEQGEYDAELAIYERFMNEAESISKLLEAPGDRNVDELNKDLTYILDKIEQHAPKLAKEKQEAEEAKVWLNEVQVAVDEISQELLKLRETVTQAKQNITKAEIDAERAAKKAKQAEIIAGLSKSGNKFDVAINALNNQAAKINQEAEVSRLKAESLTRPKVDDGSSILGKYTQEKTAPTETLQERLARLKGK